VKIQYRVKTMFICTQISNGFVILVKMITDKSAYHNAISTTFPS